MAAPRPPPAADDAFCSIIRILVDHRAVAASCLPPSQPPPCSAAPFPVLQQLSYRYRTRGRLYLLPGICAPRVLTIFNLGTLLYFRASRIIPEWIKKPVLSPSPTHLPRVAGGAINSPICTRRVRAPPIIEPTCVLSRWEGPSASTAEIGHCSAITPATAGPAGRRTPRKGRIVSGSGEKNHDLFPNF